MRVGCIGLSLTTQIGKGSRLGDGRRPGPGPVRRGPLHPAHAAAPDADLRAPAVREGPQRAQLGRRPGRR